ncbi:hypothetical protein POTOM_014848 [Populus tomentosa]|uniref:TF-B3 domain-containing protein n=1 Tax=Populus tomentosa TaxID=118781 RepID=A0A8X7ZWK7_POPTO|nr:hypothetical protein POTOM_014848 [Populus tomentosa]
MPDGQNSMEFVAFDRLQKPWKFKVSIRNEGRYRKPWLKGEWDDYVHQKGLKKGDKVIFTMDDQENGDRIYYIRAERKLFGAMCIVFVGAVTNSYILGKACSTASVDCRHPKMDDSCNFTSCFYL